MINVGIYIYDNAEVLDFSGPFEVFATADRISKEKTFNTFLISESNGVVKARAQYKVMPDYQIINHPQIDVLVIAGGEHTAEMTKIKPIKWIAAQSKKVQLVTSVCTGAFLLARAGVITSHTVTTHWEDINDLKNQYPQLNVQEGVRWVEDGNLISSAGISAGIDMSLYIVEKLYSKELALATAKQMDFSWSR